MADDKPHHYRPGNLATVKFPSSEYKLEGRPVKEGDLLRVIKQYGDWVFYRNGGEEKGIYVRRLEPGKPHKFAVGDRACVVYSQENSECSSDYPFLGRCLEPGDIIAIAEVSHKVAHLPDMISYEDPSTGHPHALYAMKLDPYDCTCSWDQIFNNDGKCRCKERQLDSPIGLGGLT